MSALALPLQHLHSGKVRELYELPDPDLLLMVATDRVSTHNVLHASAIPKKGEVLTAQTVFFARHVLAGIPTHIVAAGRRIWHYLPTSNRYPDDLHLRSYVIRKRIPHPREFIFRKRNAGSLWRALQTGSDPYGLNLPQGLPLMHEFSEPVFTPTQKSEHDEPVHFGETLQSYPNAVTLTGAAFGIMRTYLNRRGIELIDAKFEADEHMLLDEFGTGDCSRFALVSDLVSGKEPPWLDKEPVRQAAAEAWGSGPKSPLTFTAEAVEGFRDHYLRSFELITGRMLDSFQARDLDFHS